MRHLPARPACLEPYGTGRALEVDEFGQVGWNEGTFLWAQTQPLSEDFQEAERQSWRNEKKNTGMVRKAVGLNLSPTPSWPCDPEQIASPL